MMMEKIAKILAMLTVASNQHADAIDKLGKLQGVEWNKLSEQWEPVKSEGEVADMHGH